MKKGARRLHSNLSLGSLQHGSPTLYHQGWLISHASESCRSASEPKSGCRVGSYEDDAKPFETMACWSCGCGHGVIESTGPSLCMALPVSAAYCLLSFPNFVRAEKARLPCNVTNVAAELLYDNKLVQYNERANRGDEGGVV